MKLRMIGAGMTLAVLLAAGNVQAEWPSLNPFGSGGTKTAMPASGNSSWWPTWPKAKPSNGPTTWQKVQAAPGKAMNKTKETLAPLNPFGAKKTTFTGPQKKASSSWWPEWMTPEEPKGPPLTVSDWMAGQRPE